jgi:hypothetical protein
MNVTRHFTVSVFLIDIFRLGPYQWILQNNGSSLDSDIFKFVLICVNLWIEIFVFRCTFLEKVPKIRL